MPTGEEKKPLLCRLENGQWVAVGRIEPSYDLGANETYGMDVNGMGLSFDDQTIEYVVEMKCSRKVLFTMMGVDVVNIVFCKDCKYNYDTMNCPMYRKAYAFDRRDTDFCSFGVRK